jgi:hypothetical protein
MAGISDDIENLRVNRDDFMHALGEVQPAFGVSEEELQSVIQNGIIHFDSNIDVCLIFLSFYLYLTIICCRPYFVMDNFSWNRSRQVPEPLWFPFFFMVGIRLQFPGLVT